MLFVQSPVDSASSNSYADLWKDHSRLALRASTHPTDHIDTLTFSAIFLPIDHPDEHYICVTLPALIIYLLLNRGLIL